ncbi:BatD family protein [Bradyrhizobium lablabi]|uniref:BatD family protein n=1 Tax=Bradyrhizobium lablabi TaxID=722472 RepID=UPI001BAA3B4C|nr:BatD family protein [Bradyrhizobium lablabi]MBR0692276.1 BatD family protein [Bradyrhizobium lablabi]
MRRPLAIVTLLLGVLTPCEMRAQQAAPEPIVHVTLDPPRVVVGQATTLQIDVLAPNYMTSPPELPGFQVRNAVTRQLQSVNTNEQRDGVSYAGVRFEYAIYPQEPGSYAIGDQRVTIKYAAEPPATREEAVALPRVSFEAFIPDAAAALRPFVSADKLTVEQVIKRSSDQLKAGDAVTRTVTIKAEGAPAMLLPPQTFTSIEGLRLYPAQPVLEDKVEGRTDVMTSSRVDSATYMLERVGDYSLPAIDIGWWNVGSGKIERVHLDAVPLMVAPNPAAGSTVPAGQTMRGWTWGGLVELVADHWLIALLGAVGITALGWFGPGVVQRFADYYRRRSQAYLQSEAYAFSRFRHAIRHRDARAAYFALLDWLPHAEAVPPLNTIGALKTAAGDPALDREIGAIENELFASQRDSQRWSPHQLLRHVTAARRGLRHRARRREDKSLPKNLNPVGLSTAASYSGRRPAR